MQSVFLILGNQLFPLKHLKNYKDHKVVMIESFELCTNYKHHKLKIKLFLEAMRDYKDQLVSNGFSVDYTQLNTQQKTLKYVDVLKKSLEGCIQLTTFEVEDKFLEEALQVFCQQQNIEWQVLKSPMFVTSRSDFNHYLESVKKPFMKSFYEKQRKRYKVLLNKDGTPIGGKWSFDAENRKKMPKSYEVTSYPFLSNESKHSREVNALIENHFSSHPGQIDDFQWPTTRKQYLHILDYFLNNNLPDFGKYQDAINQKTPFLLHSLIAPGLNMGLILPSEVIKKTVEFFYSNDQHIPISSVEGFLRQILGWREFVRGVYQNFSEVQEITNYWGHERLLKNCWYEGTTGIPPVDDAIKKAISYGYCHHIERLMVLSNIMLLCEVHPHNVHNWFMEMYVDSSDWVMGPNVYGMGQFSDGGVFATKPYISGSNYIIKMSSYKKGEWSDIFDGLYWRFVEKNLSFFTKNPRMKMMVSHLDRMDSVRKKNIFKKAENFIYEVTK